MLNIDYNDLVDICRGLSPEETQMSIYADSSEVVDTSQEEFADLRAKNIIHWHKNRMRYIAEEPHSGVRNIDFMHHLEFLWLLTHFPQHGVSQIITDEMKAPSSIPLEGLILNTRAYNGPPENSNFNEGYTRPLGLFDNLDVINALRRSTSWCLEHKRIHPKSTALRTLELRALKLEATRRGLDVSDYPD
jgi:hypothetical protein